MYDLITYIQLFNEYAYVRKGTNIIIEFIILKVTTFDRYMQKLKLSCIIPESNNIAKYIVEIARLLKKIL